MGSRTVHQRRAGLARGGIGRRTLITALATPPVLERTGPAARQRGASGPRIPAPRPAPAPSADTLAAFRPLIQAIRWGTLAVGFALAGPNDKRALAWGAVLAIYALVRTFRPLAYRSERLGDMVAVVAEVALCGFVVIATGYWTSPFFFCLATAIAAAGFARGFAFAIRTACATVTAVAVPYHVGQVHATVQQTLAWGSELVMIALVTGYARHLFGEAEARTSEALDRITQLSSANDLLFQLHRLAQTMPASLDLDDALGSTAARVRELVQPDVIGVLVRDDTRNTWSPAFLEGGRLGREVSDAELPAPIRRSFTAPRSLWVPRLAGNAGPGISFSSGSGFYAPLRARGLLVGVMAIEFRTEPILGGLEVGLLEGLAEQVALAVDNARWFARIRTVGAEQERTRIARELHDRLGQSLAYLAFELDRISAASSDSSVQPELVALGKDVRKVVGDVRDTLYDLRTDVSEDHDLVETLEDFLERVRHRTGLTIIFRHDADQRLLLPQEREMWRIAQEAVTNAERHARCRTVCVTWRCSERDAMLEVIDDGRGFAGDRPGRLDSYGILGMHERADAIGATLTLNSTVGKGTNVRCVLSRS